MKILSLMSCNEMVYHITILKFLKFTKKKKKKKNIIFVHFISILTFATVQYIVSRNENDMI